MARHDWVEGVPVTLPKSWLAAALVGPAHDGLPPVAWPPALAGLAAALGELPAAEVLLLLAAAVALHDDAGGLPARAAATEWHLPAYRAEGDRPPCSPAAARLLRGMLNQQHAELLPELLARLDAAGQRVPDELLPAALDHGARLPRLRPALLPVLGERGRWLGAVNPAWRYAAVDLDDWASLRAAWAADLPGRAALAQTVRRRDPTAARQLIETTWRTEADAARRELLDALKPGLAMDDEPFLERALDDRDALVRRRAIDLLATLPESRLVRRMTAAAGNVLALTGGEVSPRFPATVGDAMLRDGVVRPAGHAATASERSRLLAQTVGVIPPRHWETRLRATPEEIIRGAAAGKWPRTLIAAFSAATARHCDDRWTAAILTQDGITERVGHLVATLPAEAMGPRLAAALAAGDDAAVVVFLRRWPGPWDEASGRALMEFLARQSDQPDTRHSPTLRFLARQFARQCPPSLADEAASRLELDIANKAWAAGLKLVVTTLAMRRRLVEAVE